MEVDWWEVENEFEDGVEEVTDGGGGVEDLEDLCFLCGFDWLELSGGVLLLQGEHDQELQVVQVGSLLGEMDANQSLHETDQSLHFGGHESVLLHLLGLFLKSIVIAENGLELGIDKLEDWVD